MKNTVFWDWMLEPVQHDGNLTKCGAIRRNGENLCEYVRRIEKKLNEVVSTEKVSYVCIEEYMKGFANKASNTNTLTKCAEMNGMVQYLCQKYGKVECVNVKTGRTKLGITGSIGAKKEKIKKYFADETNITEADLLEKGVHESSIPDVADAYVMARYGYEMKKE